jgi:hypothetical protein
MGQILELAGKAAAALVASLTGDSHYQCVVSLHHA